MPIECRRSPRAIRPSVVSVVIAIAILISCARSVSGQIHVGFDYRVLATNRTSTMEKEMNEAAEAGFRFRSAMGGETAAGGAEVVAIMVKSDEMKGRYSYKLLATSKTSTMEKELQEAAAAGFEYADQTVFKTAFGGQEVVCILERSAEKAAQRSEYKLLATSRTSTLQKELLQAGSAGYELMGMTLGKTAVGGNELVAILRRPGAQ